jgi:signal transduction histidine kinase
VILNVVEDYREQIAKGKVANGNVKVMCELGNNITLVEADRRRMTQVISNLLSNAIKFTKEGTITVTTKIERKEEGYGEEVVIAVKDTGTGIDSELIPRLFTKFATKSYQGTGLGLFISRSIVEAHGGKMWAENNSSSDDHDSDSKTKYNGATFYFTLPIADMLEKRMEKKGGETSQRPTMMITKRIRGKSS